MPLPGDAVDARDVARAAVVGVKMASELTDVTRRPANPCAGGGLWQQIAATSMMAMSWTKIGQAQATRGGEPGGEAANTYACSLLATRCVCMCTY